MKCPLCDSLNTENIYRDENSWFSNTDVSFPLLLDICNECGFVFQSGENSDEYERTVSEIYRTFKKNDFFSFPNRSKENLRTLEMILKHLPQKPNLNILEIGSNRGDMLYMIKERVPTANILGIDPTKYDEISVPTIHSFFKKNMFSKVFDVVVLQHVLEHIKNPTNVIADIKNIVKDECVLYIEVPDIINSLNYCVDDFTLEHVNYFALKTLADALKGFRIVDYNCSSFLRTVSTLGYEHINADSDFPNIKGLFEHYKSNKENLIKIIRNCASEGRRIIFYGVSYYFSYLYKKIKRFLVLKNCYYYDDNFNEPYESAHHLPRIKSFDKGDLVIICSTNFYVQQLIESKLKKNSGIRILRPWFSCSNN